MPGFYPYLLAALLSNPGEAAPITSTLSGKSLIIDLAESLTSAVARILQALLGHNAAQLHTVIYGQVTGIHLCTTAVILMLVALAHGMIWLYLSRKQPAGPSAAGNSGWRPLLHQAMHQPLGLLLWIYGAYFAATPILLHLTVPGQAHPLQILFDFAFDVGFFVALLWLFFRITSVIETRVKDWTSKTEGSLDNLLLPLLVKSLRVVVPVLAIILALPLLNLPYTYERVISKFTSLLIIGAVAWVLIQAVLLMEQVILSRFDIKAKDNLRARKVYTQVTVLKKTLIFIIGILTLASVLMMFEEVRRVGSSILASAGVMGIIIGFAAQRTISNLFAGLQIAATQPIRLEDAVVVEGEFGNIEEITLTFVVVRIWDDRRMIVPLSYFIEKPFQNWTRASTALSAGLLFYTDYNLPVEEIRNTVQSIVENSPLWDRRFWNLQVTDATEKSMQLRILVTASDSGKSWDLRCEIREKLLAFIQQKYPQCLPRIRAEIPQSPRCYSPEQVRADLGRESTDPLLRK